VCRSWSNLKQQPTFILPLAALNITRLGSGQSGTFPANTFLKTKEQKVQHSYEFSGVMAASLIAIACFVFDVWFVA
jgi:hypothetical protein